MTIGLVEGGFNSLIRELPDVGMHMCQPSLRHRLAVRPPRPPAPCVVALRKYEVLKMKPIYCGVTKSR